MSKFIIGELAIAKIGERVAQMVPPMDYGDSKSLIDFMCAAVGNCGCGPGGDCASSCVSGCAERGGCGPGPR